MTVLASDQRDHAAWARPRAEVRVDGALAEIPHHLREELLRYFNAIALNYRQGRWETAVLNAGKFCECVYAVLKGRAEGQYPDRVVKPGNMVDACRQLENADPTVMDRALRIQVPRALAPVYEIRNNRGIGHAGGDIDPNHMDAVYVLAASQWIMAELVRAFHRLDTATATLVVEALVEREIPLIWEVNGIRRILEPTLDVKQRVLILLYGSMSAVGDEDLRRWAGYANPSRFRTKVLRELHDDVLIHYDPKTRKTVLSPTGSKFAEEVLLAQSAIQGGEARK